jgi:drug/metabolite transporter (DMT)-like permease
MHFLILCILSSTGIFMVFKFVDRFSFPPLPVIVINYFTASLLGFVIQASPKSLPDMARSEWFPISIVIGILFIIMFFLVAYSSKKAGIAITTVASKMSVIFPILFSVLIDPGDRMTLIKAMAVACTLTGVALTVYKPGSGKLDKAAVYVPLLLFAGMGLVDSLVKFAQHHYVNDSEVAPFSSVLFLNAFISGLLVIAVMPGLFRNFVRLRIWGWGILLGAVNFGSIFFLVRALNYLPPAGRPTDSSVIFGINNIGIVALSVMAGWIIFRERLRPVNWIGVSLSAVALILFMFG